MGLFEFFKRDDKLKSEPEKAAVPKDFKSQLDLVEKEVFVKLKPFGFKKNGRTFNRRLEEGIVQVINFQSGQYPIGQGYEIPGLRENLYGKFVVNLGVCIESLYKIQRPTEDKKYYKEYECQIRDRLGTIITGRDFWWTITDDNSQITKDIIKGIETRGFEWFAGLETKAKIVANNGQRPPYHSSPRAKLDNALLVWLDDKASGTELFRDYFNNIQPARSSHKDYVKELAKDLKIEL